MLDLTNNKERIMFISPINNYYRSPLSGGYNRNNTIFTAGKKSLTKAELQQVADLKVFNHHIYEFKKGIRTLILTTEKLKYKDTVKSKLEKENIDYVIHDLDNNNMNVYFGEKPCIDVVKTFDTKLNKLTPEQDFMLGILLGYDKVKQCTRYLDFRNRPKKNIT